MGISASTIFVWFMSAFYIIAGIAPLGNLKRSRPQYVEWGYPGWWVFVTAVMEALVGILIFYPQTRVPGAALGVAIMLVAIGTLVRKKEYKHALLPVGALILTVLVGTIE